MDISTYARNYANFYEELTSSASIKEYENFFDDASIFKDPFQEVQGLKLIHNIFVDMYTKMHTSKFRVDEVICNNGVAYIRWDFIYALSDMSDTKSFQGISRVTFGDSGKVLTHIDYWDAGEHVYEQIPLLGSIIRFIKRKMHA